MATLPTAQPIAKPVQSPAAPGWRTGVMATPPDVSPAPPLACQGSPALCCQRHLSLPFPLSQDTRVDETVRTLAVFKLNSLM